MKNNQWKTKGEKTVAMPCWNPFLRVGLERSVPFEQKLQMDD